MAKAIAKTEFMENAFPGGALKLAGEFYVAQDENGEHMIFTTDSRGRLCLILKGESGHNEWINLSEKFMLSESQAVRALAVSQNRDGQIHLVFSTAKYTDNDDIFVLRPMRAVGAEWKRSFTLEADFYSGEKLNGQILLGTSNDSIVNEADIRTYPQFHLVLREAGCTTEDIWAFTVNAVTQQWKRETAFQMPINSELIIDKCVANVRRFRGLMVLSREALGHGSEVALRFVGFDPTKDRPVLQSIVQKVPEGACRIAGFDNHEGHTDIIIAGQQLMWRSAAQLYRGSKEAYTVISEDGAYSDCKQLVISQTNSSLSTWSLKSNGLLSYQEYTVPSDSNSAPTAITPIVPLLDRQNDRFSVLQHPILGKKIFVIDREEKMKMLEQDQHSLLWEDPVDVIIPDSDAVLEFKTHTVYVQVTDSTTGDPLVHHQLNLSCPSTIELITNGKSVRTGPHGITVTTDTAGSLTVIMKSQDLAVPPLIISDVADASKALVTGPLTVDPASKLWNHVATLETTNDLRSMKLPNGGGDFVKPDTSEKDLQKSLDALKQLSRLRTEIPAAQATTLSAMPASSLIDRLWGFWYFIKNSTQRGLEWGLEQLQGAWHFVVEIAGKAWNFILDTGKQIAAAAQKILEGISDGADKLIKYFEFLFNWDDILATKNILVNLTTQGLLWGVEAMGEMENQATDFFDDLRKKARALKSKSLPVDMARLKAGNDPSEMKRAKEQTDAKEESVLTSPASQYGTYHINHSSGVQDGGGSKQSNPIERLLARMANISDRIEKLVDRCKINIGALLKSKDITIEDVFQTVGVDLLEDAIALVQSLVAAALGSFTDLILLLADGLNKSIQIPVLSPLYKRLTKGAELSVLDAVSLVFAIPATFMFKFATGKGPKDIENVGDLVTLNAMKPELDARMGRLRTETTSPSPEHQHPLPNLANNNPHPFTINVVSASMMSSTSISSWSKTPANNPSDIQQPRPKQELSAKQKEAIHFNRTRFTQSSNIVASLIKIAIPTASSIYYTVNSWPRQMLPEPPYNPMTAMRSAAGKLVLWLGSFASLAKYTSDDIKNGRWDMSNKAPDPEFPQLRWIWGLGILPIIGSLGGKYLGYVISLLTTLVQSGMLLVLQLESWTERAGYSVYLAVEEWAKALGKLSSAVSGLTLGGAGYAAGVALFLTQTGCVMQIIRVGLEATGERDVLCTGMDNIDA